jgi:hypothetical protein
MNAVFLHDGMKSVKNDSPFLPGRTTFIVGKSYGYLAPIDPSLTESSVKYISNLYVQSGEEMIKLHYNKEIVQYLWNETVKNKGNNGYIFISVPKYLEKYVEYIPGVDDTENIRINYRKMIIETEDEEMMKLINTIKNTDDELIEIINS